MMCDESAEQLKRYVRHVNFSNQIGEEARRLGVPAEVINLFSWYEVETS